MNNDDILNPLDVALIAQTYNVTEDRLPVLRVIVKHACERVINDAGEDAWPSMYLRAAACSAVVTVLCRSDKELQRQLAVAYWNFLRLHRGTKRWTSLH